MALIKNDSINENLSSVLESLYLLYRSGANQAANLLLQESSSEIGKSDNHKILFNLLKLIGKYELNDFNADDFTELTNNIKKPIEELNIQFFTAWTHFLLGYHSKNERSLKLAAQLFLENDQLNELYEVYYWMQNYKLLPNEDKVAIFLRTYPTNSIYSLIMGNQYFLNESIPLTAIQKIQAKTWLPDQNEVEDLEDDNSFDCWLISKKGIVPSTYKSLNLKDENYLDLYSGIIQDRGQFVFLMISELNCLAFLTISQLTGATLTQLAEFIDRDKETSLQILKSLEVQGIQIQKKNQRYFLELQSKPNIIIPRTLKVIGLHQFVKKKLTIFNKAALIETLQLTPYGAEALVNKWMQLKIIQIECSIEKKETWKFI